MKGFLLIVFVTIPLLCFSQVDGEIELTGFILGQYRKAVHTQLGPPIQRIDTDDGWIYEFHALRPDTSVYALFKYSESDTSRIYSIQLNGHEYNAMHSFNGLRLGADQREVDRLFGMYTKTDTLDNPNVVIRFYANTNYSFELDENGKLYGIQISGDILSNEPLQPVPDIKGFRDAIRSKNIDSLLVHLSPDVELYHKNKVITYQGAARDEFAREDSELLKYLLGAKESVWFAFEKERTTPTPELRLFTEKKLTTTVYKFYKSKVLEEVVFLPHAGQWKVYEIKFRN